MGGSSPRQPGQREADENGGDHEPVRKSYVLFLNKFLPHRLENASARDLRGPDERCGQWSHSALSHGGTERLSASCALMLRIGKIVSLAGAALLLSGLSISIAGAETAAVSKPGNHPQLPDSSTRDRPGMTVDQQEKLKKELIDARNRQSQVKAKESAAHAKAKKP